MPAGGMGRSGLPWRRHQQRALDALAGTSAERSRAWVVLPPGAGKTALGCEWARRTGLPVVVFSPNVAVAEQWADTWNDWFADPADPADRAGRDRAMDTRLTALTYQSLAVFDPDAPDPEEPGSPLVRLHPRGQELVDRLSALGAVAIVLDECHHLLQVWGELLAEVLARLPGAVVLGLTATPPPVMTADEAERVDTLFGGVCFSASIPAVVREGDLVPFAELAWLTAPTPAETDWLRGQALVWEELLTGLMDPAWGFLSFLDLRYGPDGAATWDDVLRRTPAVADALLRLHSAGLFELPRAGIVLQPQHRIAPGVDDWMVLADQWVRHGLDQGAEVARSRLRRALPSVGYQLTGQGVRRGAAPADALLARSAAKAEAAASIASQTLQSWPDARLLVLCDYARAAPVGAALDSVVDEDAGSALRVLEALLRDPVTAAAAPLVVTGAQLAGTAETLEALLAFGGEAIGRDPAVDADPGRPWAQITGEEPGRWARVVSAFLADGPTRVLVGTRAMLGEGWDARAVTCVVDLTSATTSTAVTQTRGRALRRDPAHPDKVAVNWTVTCATPAHPLGGRDYGRLVRKHAGWFAVDEAGDVVDGVAHCDPELDDLAPPDPARFDDLNTRALLRADDHAAIVRAWAAIGPEPVAPTATLDVIGGTLAPGDPADPVGEHLVLTRTNRLGVARRAGNAGLVGRWAGVAAFALAAGIMAAGPASLPLLGLALAIGVAGTLLGVAGWRGWRAFRALGATRPPTLLDYGRAVADGLHAAEAIGVGAEAVRVQRVDDAVVRLWLDGGTPEDTVRFAQAVEEVLAPIGRPRYLVRRGVVGTPGLRLARALRAGVGDPPARVVVAHAVPEIVGHTRASADAFGAAWARWIAGAAPAAVFATREVLAPSAGSTPLPGEVRLRLRRQW